VAVRDWLGAQPGPAGQRTIHGLLPVPNGAVPLWIPAPSATESLTPIQVEEFVAAIRRHTMARHAVLLAWDIPDATRQRAAELQAAHDLSLHLTPLRWLTIADGEAPALLQCSFSSGRHS
jgi:hypothetical protein